MNNKKYLWPFSFFFLLFATIAAYGPYTVLYFQSLSFTGTQIGLLTGIGSLVTLISLPLITGLADQKNKHQLIMGFSLIVVISGLILFPYLKSFILLFGLAILFSIFFSPVMALSNSSAMYMLGDKKDLYGRVRLGGTIGFSIVATITGALVEDYGLKIAFMSAAILLSIAFIVSQKMEYGEEGVSGRSIEKGKAFEMLRNPHFLLFLLIGFSGGVAFSILNAYFFPYMKALGSGESVMGLALTIGAISEIPILIFVNRFIKRYKAYTLLLFSIAMTGLRFLLLAVAPTPMFVLFVQLLNGFNFPLLMVAAVTYADEQALPGFRATAQGLFGAANGGLGSAVGGFVGGLLFEGLGAQGMYFVIFLFITLVLVTVSLIHRMLPPEKENLQPYHL